MTTGLERLPVRFRPYRREPRLWPVPSRQRTSRGRLRKGELRPADPIRRTAIRPIPVPYRHLLLNHPPPKSWPARLRAVPRFPRPKWPSYVTSRDVLVLRERNITRRFICFARRSNWIRLARPIIIILASR